MAMGADVPVGGVPVGGLVVVSRLELPPMELAALGLGLRNQKPGSSSGVFDFRRRNSALKDRAFRFPLVGRQRI